MNLKEYIVNVLAGVDKTQIDEVWFEVRVNHNLVVDDDGNQLIKFKVIRK